ncbi:MAG: hypothetical protein COB38_09655 [Gammaproteobacteria bacterium]|nr:MAG: hypothetical protein COB38_09655 [Gammaproteobacteria bacterium]
MPLSNPSQATNSNTSKTDNSNTLLDQASLTITNSNLNTRLTIKQQKKVALLGLNGAGKSTFIRNLIGESNNLDLELLYQTNNSIKNDHPLSLKPDELKFKKLMGYQADTMLSMGHLSAGEYLHLCAGFKQVSSAEYNKIVQQIISDWSLEKLLHQSLQSLSKGNMQKMAIAQVFINNPQFLFFDEPCQSLDPIEQERFNNNIKELIDFSLCLFSTHNVNHALTVADDILLIHQSKIAYFYQEKSQKNYLLFSFENKEKISKILSRSDIEYEYLGSNLYKITGSDIIDEFVKENHSSFEFCLPEKEALMPLFRLLASNEWQPSDLAIDQAGEL